MITVSAIAAMDKNRAIGFKNKLPWHMPVDMKYFVETTLGKPVIMGRKTFEAIGKALPKRPNIIITRQKEFETPNCRVVFTIEDALESAKKEAQKLGVNEVFIIGGQEIYSLALPFTNRIYLTHIDVAVDNADTFFPDFNLSEWKVVSDRLYNRDVQNPYNCRFLVYERI